MTQITERLRRANSYEQPSAETNRFQSSATNGLVLEAADLIDRLTSERDTARAEIEVQQREKDSLRAQIERLERGLISQADRDEATPLRSHAVGVTEDEAEEMIAKLLEAARGYDVHHGRSDYRKEFLEQKVRVMAAIASRPAPSEEELRKAIEPFAGVGQWLMAGKRLDEQPAVTFPGINGYTVVLTVGHFRAAHLAFLAGRSQKPDVGTTLCIARGGEAIKGALCDAAQFIDTVSQDAKREGWWTDWDAEMRLKITRALEILEGRRNNSPAKRLQRPETYTL